MYMRLTYALAIFAGVAQSQDNASCPTNFQSGRGTCEPFQGGPSSGVPFPPISPSDYSIIGPALQAVHSSSSPPTGLAIDPNEVLYLTYPRNSGPTPNNVVICPTYDTEEPWPNAEIQNCTSGQNASECFINVQNVVLDALNQLWIVDSGIPPGSQDAVEYGAKIMSFDWQTRALKKTYVVPQSLLHDGANLNDVRINNTLGTGGFAFMTDESKYGSIFSVDLDSGEVTRRLFNTTVTQPDVKYVGIYNGESIYAWNGTQKSYLNVGADGIALQSGNVYWGDLASRRYYFVPQDLLVNASKSEAEVLAGVVFPDQIGTEQAGFTADDKGRVYVLASEHNAIFYVDTLQSQVTEEINGVPPGGSGLVDPENYVSKTLVRSALIQHADSAAIWDGWLYFCTNQLALRPLTQYKNVDNRKAPFLSYRVWIGAGPAI